MRQAYFHLLEAKEFLRNELKKIILFYDFNILYLKAKHTVSIYGSSCVNNNLWLRSLFFVQGFFEEGAACMPHIWYVGAEFWYNVLFPFQAVLFGFHKALGVAFTVLLSCGSIGWAWYQSVDQDAMPFQQQKLPYELSVLNLPVTNLYLYLVGRQILIKISTSLLGLVITPTASAFSSAG